MTTVAEIPPFKEVFIRRFTLNTYALLAFVPLYVTRYTLPFAGYVFRIWDVAIRFSHFAYANFYGHVRV